MKQNYFSKIVLTLFGLCAFGATKAQTVTTFNYTGNMQTYTVPAGITSIEVDMLGASGGFSFAGGVLQTNHIPGDGGRIETTLTVTPGATLNIYVAGAGNNAPDNATGGIGGYNGGSAAGTTGSHAGGGGGGASDIRIGGIALVNRVIVAGGGGGSAYNYVSNDNGGNGGETTGANGQSNSNPNDVSVGIGGDQASGGAGGQWSGYSAGTSGSLGLGGTGGSGTSGGGGGAGYYGGGGGSWSGGGGGSSYADAGLTSATTHTQGFNNGDGQIIITEICSIDINTTTTNFTMSANQASGTYQWINCLDNSPITGETNQTYTADANGDYAVIITEGPCSDTSACITIAGVGIDELTKMVTSIYPNPTNGQITISKDGNFNYSIVNIIGKVVLTGQGNNNINIDLYRYSRGAYFITIDSDNKTETIKVIKQ